MSDAVEADTAFAADLYRQLAESEPGNLFFSPHSISTALAMTLAGADGATKEQLVAALHLRIPEPAFHDALNALDQALIEPRTKDDPAQEGDPLEITTANSLWGQKGFPFRKAFLDRLAASYDAGMNVVDFTSQAEASRVAINDWVAQRTKGKITELLPEGVVTDLTRLVLVNAITFNASWTQPFDDARELPFTLADGTDTTAPLMAGGRGTIMDGAGWRAAAIPYVGGAHLVAIVPDDITSFDLTPDVLRQAAVPGPEGDVTLPKFSITSELALPDVLKGLGVTDLFDERTADLSRMDGARDLHVSAIVHQATIAVDEQGTEAVAATAVGAGAVSMPVTPEPLVIDRPSSSPSPTTPPAPCSSPGGSSTRGREAPSLLGRTAGSPATSIAVRCPRERSGDTHFRGSI